MKIRIAAESGTKENIVASAFMIVQPYTDRRDRLNTAIVVSEHSTAPEAFVELERLAEKLVGFDLPSDMIEMLVVDSARQPVVRGH